METVKILTGDDKEVEVKLSLAKKSQKIVELREDLGETDEPIFLPNLSKEILERIFEFLQKEEDDEITKTWLNDEFFYVEHDVLFTIMRSANYLDINSLFDLSCKAVADLIRGKSTEEIIENFSKPRAESTVNRLE